MIYRICQYLLRVVFKILFRWEIYGRENLNIRGGAILAGNHTSILDPLLLGAPLLRKAYYVSRASLFHPRPWGWFLRKINAVAVEREHPSLSSFKRLLNLLGSGEIVVIFPEGTRRLDGAPVAAKGGLGMLVARAGVPVIPAYVSGAARILPKGRRFPRPAKVRIIYGPPLYFSPESEESQVKAYFQRISGRVMEAIQLLKGQMEG